MIVDPIKTARLVTREVRNGERDGTATKVAVARRTYRTDSADLWDALTNQDRLPAGEAWSLSPDGKAFVTEAAEGWAAGAVQAGDAPDAASAAAARTIAFYTTDPTARAE